jgi:hypothetical protein
MTKYLALFRQELKRHHVRWCQDEGCPIRHRRGSGYVDYVGTEEEMLIVHLGWYADDVNHLVLGLHEIGHIIGEHHRKFRKESPSYLARWQREKEAVEFAFARLASLKVRIPKELRAAEEQEWVRWLPKTLKAHWAA